MNRIDRHNYAEKAALFIAAHGGRPHLISRGPIKRWKIDQTTPEQWRAWMRYLQGLGVATRLYHQRGYMSAPAPWPSDFDDDRSRDQDERDGRHFRDVA